MVGGGGSLGSAASCGREGSACVGCGEWELIGMGRNGTHWDDMVGRVGENRMGGYGMTKRNRER